MHALTDSVDLFFLMSGLSHVPCCAFISMLQLGSFLHFSDSHTIFLLSFRSVFLRSDGKSMNVENIEEKEDDKRGSALLGVLASATFFRLSVFTHHIPAQDSHAERWRKKHEQARSGQQRRRKRKRKCHCWVMWTNEEAARQQTDGEKERVKEKQR